MKNAAISAIALSMMLTGIAGAQYGLMENYEGTDRFGDFINLTDGINFTYGGASGGGEGPGTEFEGTRGFGWGTGAAFTDGFGIQVRAAAANNGPDVLDLTQSVNGLTSTGYTISLRDVDADGVGGADEFQFIVEDDLVPPGQEIFTITGLPLNTYQTLTFNPGDGAAGPDGLVNRARFKQFIIRASAISGGGANLNVDNIGFTGNLVPLSYDVANFDGYDAGTLAAPGTPGRANTLNNFGGFIESFSFGSAVTGAAITNIGGSDDVLEMSFDGLNAGFFLDLGPAAGSQADVSAATGISFDMATVDPGQDVTVIVETVDANSFGDRCTITITPGTTLTNFEIPFTSLTCGAQGFSPDKVNRLTFLPATADAGAFGITIRLNNVSFYGNPTSVDNWDAHTY